MQIYPVINGLKYDWSSAEIIIAGVPFSGIKSLNYKHSKTPGKVRGTSAQKRARTRGEYDAEGDFEIYKADYIDFLTRLVATGAGRGTMEIEYNIIAQYQELISGNPVIVTDTVRGCLTTNAEHGGSEGGDALVVKVSFDAMYLLENGLAPLTGMKF